MRRARAALALLLLRTALADVIFRVPEVQVQHAANTKPVGSVRANGSRANDSELETSYGLLEVREYFVEHETSTPDARKAALELVLENIPDTLPGCGTCSRRELQYCETRVLADHCCCERQAFPEPFPWIPHTCYIGPGRCKPLVHDCATYKRLRDCCCYKRMAERWKGILSKSSRVGVTGISLLLLSMLLFVAYL